MEQASGCGGGPNLLDRTGLCLLSLNGGGVHGLFMLYVLKYIMDRPLRQGKSSALADNHILLSDISRTTLSLHREGLQQEFHPA